MDVQDCHSYEFDNFRIDVAERCLWRDGKPVQLTPKAFDTLLALVMRSGHLVEKDELLKEVWPDTFVEEATLTQNISTLRKVLGQDSNGHQYIETVPKRGYRFRADVKDVRDGDIEIVIRQRRSEAVVIEEEEDAPTAKPENLAIPVARLQIPNHPRRWKTYLLLAAICLASIVFVTYLQYRSHAAKVGAIKSIAVLPFKTLGIEDQKELLGLGMADAIIIHLSKFEKPLTLPTSTVYKYTDDGRDVISIGRELGVEAVLDGTVQRSGQRVRVTAQLIRLSDGKTLWADKFDEEYSNIFTVQDSISEKLSETLLLQIAGGDKKRMASRFTQNTEAYQSYLMGLYLWSRGREEIAKSIPYFERAVEQDQNFALAYTYLADCYYYNAATKGPVASYDESLKRARDNVARALSLDETIAEAHTVVAGIKTLEKDYVSAEIEHKRALDLNPNFARGHNRYGVFLFSRSDLDGAVRELRRGQELDPASRVANAALANMLLFVRQYDEAIKYAGRAVEIDPTYAPGRHALGEAYLLKGIYDEAIRQFEHISRSNASSVNIQLAKSDLVIAYAGAGRRTEAQKLLQELLQSSEGLLPYDFATIYAALGDKDKGLEWLEKEKQTPFREATLKFDPFLDPLRSDQRFTQLLQRPIQDD